MSNSSEILNELGRLCPGDHEHQHLINGRAEKAAVYPDGLCRAICRGLLKEIDMEQRKIKPILGLSALDKVGEIPESEEESQCWKSAWDDVSGKELDPNGVKAARALETQHVDLKKVWRKCLEQKSSDKGSK